MDSETKKIKRNSLFEWFNRNGILDFKAVIFVDDKFLKKYNMTHDEFDEMLKDSFEEGLHYYHIPKDKEVYIIDKYCRDGFLSEYS